jgi:hypothetical protein
MVGVGRDLKVWELPEGWKFVKAHDLVLMTVSCMGGDVEGIAIG